MWLRRPSAGGAAGRRSRYRGAPLHLLARLLSCLPLVLALLASAADACAEDKPKKRYFYFGYDYGSQAEINPLWVFVNRGFDVLQIRVNSRNIFAHEYGDDARNVAQNLANPISRVQEGGTSKFVRQEVLPLSWTRSTARWVPNYTLHLIGGGSEFVMLTEWFEAYGAPAPALWSGVTLMAAAFVNETLENKGVAGRNTDAIADWYFFDLGAILLFSFEPVKRFFSRHLVIMDWSKQPAFTLPGKELHNQGNCFAAKFAVPYIPRLRLFSYFGMSTLFGLSWLIDGSHSISAAGGVNSTRLRSQSSGNVENVVQFAPSAGLFVDKNNSLLFALQWSDIQDYFVNVNVYPGVIKLLPGMGTWTAISRTGAFVLGVSTTYTFGVGFGKL
jgi:hypothetical protein